MELNNWYKNNESDQIWWLNNSREKIGVFIFSFDKQHEINLFTDYPDKLTAEQLAIFDKENPFWADFFADRRK